MKKKYYYCGIVKFSQNQAVERMIPVIQSQDLFPFLGEQKYRKKLKIICGCKCRETQLMLTAAIQKEYTIASFIQLKLENPSLSFLLWNFAIESISFSKGK